MKTNTIGTLVIPLSPGDLSNVNHLTESNKYKVEVKKSEDKEFTTCFVYETDNYAGNRFNSERRSQKSVAFTNFSFEETSVDVRITCNFNVDSVTIRPLNFAIPKSKDNNVINFTLESPKKISIEVNDRLNPLFIFADAPDIPNTSATYYYGPGVHQIGLNMIIKSGESVYIAGGAIVQGSFKIEDYASNVKISGRGILNVGTSQLKTNDCGWISQHNTISAKANNHLQLEGIILTNATAWTISITDSRGWDMPNAIGLKGDSSYNNQYRNLKLVSWNGCTDGIWFDGDNAIIDDCFIFNNDDCITTHGSNNCKISNIVFWGGAWGRFFMHTDYASSSNITIENINIIGKECYEIIRICCESNRVSVLKDFTFRNIRVEEHSDIFLGMNLNNTKIINWIFDGITVDTKNINEGSIYSAQPDMISKITFSDFKIGGIAAESLADINIKQNENVSNIVFS